MLRNKRYEGYSDTDDDSLKFLVIYYIISFEGYYAMQRNKVKSFPDSGLIECEKRKPGKRKFNNISLAILLLNRYIFADGL